MINILKDVFDSITLVIIFIIAIGTLLIDGPKLKGKEYTKELTIIKGISYFYILFGIVVFILLRRF